MGGEKNVYSWITESRYQTIKNISQLSGAIGGKIIGGDLHSSKIGTDRAIEHNALPIILGALIAGSLKVTDILMSIDDGVTLATGVYEGDTDKMIEGGSNLALGLAPIPGIKTGTKLGSKVIVSGTSKILPCKSIGLRDVKKGNILSLKQKPGTNKTSFKKKVDALSRAASKGELKVVKNPKRDPKLTKAYRKQLENKIKLQYGKQNPEFAQKIKERLRDKIDIDHIIELQIGGKDIKSNLKILDQSTNRSFGSQIQHQIKKLPEGAKIDKIIIKSKK